MVLKWLRAVLERKSNPSTRIVEIETEADILDSEDTRTLSSVDSDVEGREENLEDSRRGLKWWRAIFKRSGRYESEYMQTETETSRRTTIRTRSGRGLRVGESVEAIDHHRRGSHRSRAIFNYFTRGRVLRPVAGSERDGGWPSSYYTSSTTSRILSSGDSSEDSSIRDPEENQLLFSQAVDASRIYRLLQDFEIRVLEILPGDEEIVCCRLKYTSLIAPRRYNALSYTWGNISRRKNINVNGYPLQVTENCKAALKELRREASFKQKRQIIWIDAICLYVNQHEAEHH